MPLTIESTERDNAAAVITLKGELTLGADCNRLHQFIHSSIESGQRHLVFDLAGVAQIDSTGIGQFIDAYSSLEKLGGRITLAGASGAVRDAFRVTRLDTVFPLVASVTAAFEPAREKL
jgi:anti-sigma B factor antagonist